MMLGRAETESEAWEMLLRGLQYFLTKHTYKTLVVILLAAGSMLYVCLDYFRTERVNVSKALPIGGQISLMPRAWAGGEPIRIGGKLYGYADPAFDLTAWKLAGESALLVHDKRSGAIFRVETSALSREQLKKLK